MKAASRNTSRFLVLVALISCERGAATNTILANEKSPDSKHVAVFLRQHIEAARFSDGYFLVIVNPSSDMQSVVDKADIHGIAVFVATNAASVTVAWAGSDSLRVECNKCGMSKADTVKAEKTFDNVVIRYIGFPDA